VHYYSLFGFNFIGETVGIHKNQALLDFCPLPSAFNSPIIDKIIEILIKNLAKRIRRRGYGRN
jgi:hypothetical protein